MKRLLVGFVLMLSAPVASAETPHVGVMADVGVPDGASSSLVVRPLRHVRFHGGIGYNLVSTGWRGGLTLLALTGTATPTLSVDYGHYAEGDANQLARMFSGDPSYSSSYLERVGYDYVNAHVGFELGSARTRFYLRAGVSRVTTDLRDTHAMTTMDAGTVTVASDSHVSVWTLSGRMGLVIYLM